jgi:hypothetical protein
MLKVEPLNMHWLDQVPDAADLCCHGGVRMVLDGEVLLQTDEDYAVSTGAVHLLRTLQRDHTDTDQVAEHLIPHCGHFMVADDESQTVLNIGCADGVNWWVSHIDGDVVLTSETGLEVQVSDRDWCQAVIGFSEQVSAFYGPADQKKPPDDLSEDWYPVFLDEWRRLRAEASCGG